jgi:RNA polymerase sigma-70 factor (ECF subfamily)
MKREAIGPQFDARGEQLATTQWSLVVAAGNRDHADADAALKVLCQHYWYPVYAFVRRRGHAAADTTGALEFPGGVLPDATSQLVFQHGEHVESIPIEPAQQYLEQVKAFCDSVRRGQLTSPAEDGLTNMRALEDVARRLQKL